MKKYSYKLLVLIILVYVAVIGVFVANAQEKDYGLVTLSYVNAEREARGLDPLGYSYALEAIAAWYNAEMVRQGTFQHNIYPDEERDEYYVQLVEQFNEGFLYKAINAYQDIIYERTGSTKEVPPSVVIAAFERSPKHAEALYRPTAKYIGVDHRAGYNRVIATYMIGLRMEDW